MENSRGDFLRLFLWLRVGIVIFIATCIFGARVGFAIVGIVALIRLKPNIRNFQSPTRTHHLKVYDWSFLRFAVFASMVGVIWVARSIVLIGGFWLAAVVVGACLSYAVMLIFLTLNIFMPSALSLIVVRVDGAVKEWHLKISVFATRETDYLWLPEGILLLSQEDEIDGPVYRWDINSRESIDRYPFNIVLGQYPCLRQVTLERDFQWLEALWAQYKVFPVEIQKLEIEVTSHSEDYDTEVREFFGANLGSWKGFPNYYYRNAQLVEGGKGSHGCEFYRTALSQIPERSVAYQNLRSQLKAKIAAMEKNKEGISPSESLTSSTVA